MKLSDFNTTSKDEFQGTSYVITSDMILPLAESSIIGLSAPDDNYIVTLPDSVNDGVKVVIGNTGVTKIKIKLNTGEYYVLLPEMVLNFVKRDASTWFVIKDCDDYPIVPENYTTKTETTTISYDVLGTFDKRIPISPNKWLCLTITSSIGYNNNNSYEPYDKDFYYSSMFVMEKIGDNYINSSSVILPANKYYYINVLSDNIIVLAHSVLIRVDDDGGRTETPALPNYDIYSETIEFGIIDSSNNITLQGDVIETTSINQFFITEDTYTVGLIYNTDERDSERIRYKIKHIFLNELSNLVITCIKWIDSVHEKNISQPNYSEKIYGWDYYIEGHQCVYDFLNNESLLMNDIYSDQCGIYNQSYFPYTFEEENSTNSYLYKLSDRKYIQIEDSICSLYNIRMITYDNTYNIASIQHYDIHINTSGNPKKFFLKNVLVQNENKFIISYEDREYYWETSGPNHWDYKTHNKIDYFNNSTTAMTMYDSDSAVTVIKGWRIDTIGGYYSNEYPSVLEHINIIDQHYTAGGYDGNIYFLQLGINDVTGSISSVDNIQTLTDKSWNYHGIIIEEMKDHIEWLGIESNIVYDTIIQKFKN